MGTAADRRRRREAWFKRGAHAFACVVTPPQPYGYVCPLCLRLFTREELHAHNLTDEHVPPEAVGGSRLLLTCKDCNGHASGLFDKHMAAEERLRTWGKPHTIGPLPGSVTFEGIRNTGSIGFDGEKFLVLGDPGQNNPVTLAAHTESLTRLADGSTFQLSFRLDHNAARARIGWMRSAYLAAFAVYGYRYVMQAAFRSLRAAIADPDGAEFDAVLVQAPDEGSLDPRIAEVTEPESLVGCRAVVFGPRLILLPPWLAPEDWFATLRQRLIDLGEASIGFGTVIGRRLPENPLYLTDG